MELDLTTAAREVQKSERDQTTFDKSADSSTTLCSKPFRDRLFQKFGQN